MAQLIILGNGFDLQCGLQTSYKDFFEWLRQDDKRANNNLWTVYFLSNPPEGTQWIDVEGSILEAIKYNFNDSISRSPKWIYLAEKCIDSRYIYEPPTNLRGVLMYIINETNNNNGVSAHLNNYWFLNELIAFEHQYSDYLNHILLSGNTKYLINVGKLMKMITEGNKVDILNFNYTNPFNYYYQPITTGISLDDMIEVESVNNVHGTFNKKNTIFGIDNTAEVPLEAQIFTKTHRKILQDNSNSTLPLNIRTIKCYGHSLGKADYSYFQSIFDNYNLYESSLTLQFYFTIYDKNNETNIIRNATERIYKLITEYGKTLDNKDKGKNLLHKLLLEGRVQIKFLANIN